jgi:glutamine---fructose-6-phosphate transaminase (isomerizing)
MGPTEQTIFEQFPYWSKAIGAIEPPREAEVLVFVGCGSSYYIALALAAIANDGGRRAIAVPGGEWLVRPQSYLANWRSTHVVTLSRSGETTETVAAAKASRAAGAFVTAITVEAESSLAKNCDRLVAAGTHPVEGVVMTVSASLMLLLGIQLLGRTVSPAVVDAARKLLDDVDAELPALIAGKSHLVYLGGGANYGIACEGALKLMEMSQIYTQAFHPLEYRHGPISLVDDATMAVMLYSGEREAEAKLVREIVDKGGRVIGIGGPGDASFALGVDPVVSGLACLPALQLLGERAAQSRNINTVAPRHLTKVVMLG